MAWPQQVRSVARAGATTSRHLQVEPFISSFSCAGSVHVTFNDLFERAEHPVVPRNTEFVIRTHRKFEDCRSAVDVEAVADMAIYILQKQNFRNVLCVRLIHALFGSIVGYIAKLLRCMHKLVVCYITGHGIWHKIGLVTRMVVSTWEVVFVLLQNIVCATRVAATLILLFLPFSLGRKLFLISNSDEQHIGLGSFMTQLSCYRLTTRVISTLWLIGLNTSETQQFLEPEPICNIGNMA